MNNRENSSTGSSSQNRRRSRQQGTDLKVSFEFFPPKTPELEQILWKSIQTLAPVDPDFVSVTYGAGGSTRERTHATVSRLVNETGLKPAAHLTCVGASRAEVDEVIRGYWDAGIRHIVALRGDPAGGIGTTFEPHPDGYENSTALVEGIRRIGDFDVSVSAYPEKHPESGIQSGHRCAESQDRCRRNARHNPVLFR